MRLRRITWRSHVPLWHLVWGLREMQAKGALVDYDRDPEWRVTW
jgi:hypothetical protein